jgi:hypothetical protein
MMTTWIGGASAGAPPLGRTCAALSALFLMTAGCTASVSTAAPPPPPAAGGAILDWTINGTKDPAQCTATGATTFNVSLFNSAGGSAGQFVQDCSAFATSINGLFPDTYTGRANLLDSGGLPRTTSVSLAPFDVVDGVSTTVAVDFPANSFF